MIIESGRVVRLELGKVWVETISRSTCSNCSAKAGCGQSSLSDYMSAANLVAVSNASELACSEGDLVEIGIDDAALAKASLLTYAVPLIMLLLGAVAGEALSSELGAVIGAIIGLATGAWVANKIGDSLALNPRFSPVLTRVLNS